MQYRLECDHYDSDRVIPQGTIVGDGTDFPWRYLESAPERFDSLSGRTYPAILAGEAKAPSREMTPLDDEAKKLFMKHFSMGAPPRDPTAKIPLQGTGNVGLTPVKVEPILDNNVPIMGPAKAKAT